jgi:hypothetical protein
MSARPLLPHGVLAEQRSCERLPLSAAPVSSLVRVTQAQHRWLDPVEWHRVGRGLRREFPSLTSQDIESIIDSLPDDGAPYLLVAHELVQRDGKEFVSQVTRIRPRELDTCIGRGVWQFFLISEPLSTEPSTNIGDQTSASLATNGAINIQHGRISRDGQPEPTSFGLIPRVATDLGEVVEHSEQVRIYRAAVRVASRINR